MGGLAEDQAVAGRWYKMALDGGLSDAATRLRRVGVYRLSGVDEWFRFSPMVSPLLSPPPAPQWGLFRNIPTLHYSGDFDVTSPSPCSGDFYVTFPTVLQWAWVTSSPHCTAAGNITSLTQLYHRRVLWTRR